VRKVPLPFLALCPDGLQILPAISTIVRLCFVGKQNPKCCGSMHKQIAVTFDSPGRAAPLRSRNSSTSALGRYRPSQSTSGHIRKCRFPPSASGVQRSMNGPRAQSKCSRQSSRAAFARDADCATSCPLWLFFAASRTPGRPRAGTHRPASASALLSTKKTRPSQRGRARSLSRLISDCNPETTILGPFL